MYTWYFASIAGVIWAHYTTLTVARQAAIIAPSIYHIKATINAFITSDKDMNEAFNSSSLTKDKITKIHGILSVACILLYLNA